MKHHRQAGLAAATAAVTLTLGLLPGCRSFDEDWRRAGEPAAGAPIGTGRWTGTWQNTNNTHSGVLRAVVQAPDGTNYTARYYAEWGTHHGTFRSPLPGVWHDGRLAFSASKRVVGFRIDTAGTLTDTALDATYTSRFDVGTFTLRRP